MSQLTPDDTAAIGQLLQALQSSDNSLRSQAEEVLQNNWFAERHDILLMGLVAQIASSTDPTVRSFAALLFRRIAGKTRQTKTGENIDTYISIAENDALSIRQRLLETLPFETDRGSRNKISDAVAEIARQCIEARTPWTELLAALVDLSMAPDATKREIAFRIIATTPAIMEDQNDEAVAGAFSRAFKDDSVSVRLTAMDAFAAFFRNSVSKKNQAKYFDILPELLNILPGLKESQDSEELGKALLTLIDLAETAPKMFRRTFSNLVQFSISVIQDRELSDICRQNALELMATFADNAPSMCKKDPTYTNDMITQCLSLMTDLGEDDETADWLSSVEIDQDDADQNHVVGEQCMDRLANRLGGSVVLAPTFNWLPRMMSSREWRDRHAALMAISAISEGCRDLMIGELNQVIELVVPALSDAHPRVRWAGCNALGQMSTDFAPTMQKEHHEKVLRAIIPVLNSPESRVKSHAAAALVNFCEEAETTILAPYLDELLMHLLQLLGDNHERYVQEQALSTIATIADAAEQAFSRYYDQLMPLLFAVLQRENDKEIRLLRAKAMECATLIAMAVGRERLGKDAEVLLQLLATVQQSIQDADDPQAQYLMHCWGRMCRVLKYEFLPYLDHVLPPLLELASVKADVQVLQDEEQADQLEQDGWELLPIKGKTVGIRTSTMEDKHMAIELLVVYAQVLEGSFSPYVHGIMEQIAIPGLAFYFHDAVRSISARLVPQLLNCYMKSLPTFSVAALPQQIQEQLGAFPLELRPLAAFWLSILPNLIAVLQDEPAIEIQAEIYQCFYESVEVVGDALWNQTLSSDHMKLFINAVNKTLADYQKRVDQREADRQGATADDAEDDAEDVLLAIEDDQTLLSDINKAFHVIFKYHHSAFLPAWKSLIDIFTKFLEGRDTTQRQWVLCIIDDVVEYGLDADGHVVVVFDKPHTDDDIKARMEQERGERDEFIAQFIEENKQFIGTALVDGLCHPNAAIRQAAAYGVGVATKKRNGKWLPMLLEALPLLFQATRVPDARGEENVYATENACAAIAKILHEYRKEIPNVDAVIGEWIGTLPVTNDEEAAPFVYRYLQTLMESAHPAVVNQKDKVFVHIAQAIVADTLTGKTGKDVVALARTFFASFGMDELPLLSQFSEEAQEKIREFFKG